MSFSRCLAVLSAAVSGVSLFCEYLWRILYLGSFAIDVSEVYLGRDEVAAYNSSLFLFLCARLR